MPKLWLRCRLYSNVCAVLNGPNSGKLLMSVTGRPPQWSRSLRGWVVQEKTAGDVIAAADRANYRVTVLDYRGEALVDLSPSTPRPMLRQPVVFAPEQLDLGLGDAS